MPKPGRAHKVDLVTVRKAGISTAAHGGEFALIIENQVDAIRAPVLRDDRTGADQADAVMADGLRDFILHFRRDLHPDEAAGLTLVAGVIFRHWLGTGWFDWRARKIGDRPGKKRAAQQAECRTRGYGNPFSHLSTL